MKSITNFLKQHSSVVLLLIVTTLLSVSSYGQNNGQGQYLTRQRLTFASINREYAIYIPKNYNSARPVPLVLLFHGFSNNISTMFNDSQMQVLADANNFIYAIPQGLGRSPGWNIGLSFGGNADDLGFTRSLIDRISSNYSINAARVYAAGFSNGGFFSYQLACELSDKIAAIASVAGSMNPRWIGGSNPTCSPTHPMPVMQITGTSDFVIPIRGGGFGGGAALSTVFNYWKNYNKTNNTATVTNINSSTKRSIFNNGSKGSTIEFLEISGRGHEWPKTATAGLRQNASIRIWEFFSKYDINGLITSPREADNTFEETGIAIYPNPVSSEFTISNVNFTEAMPYRIISPTGQTVMEGEISSATQRVDISSLSESLYFLNIGENTFKIFKTR
jgi:poly(3-hydroxybutyrate) depolymerase